MRLKVSVILILYYIFISGNTYSQVYVLDSIEYNYWVQLHDFKIENNQYFFESPEGRLIESDSIIFDTEVFFNNYQSNFILNYIDSVQFVIVSRTLKNSYKEKNMSQQAGSFLRFCWFKGTYPTIIKLEDINSDSILMSVKIGNGVNEYHGELIVDTTFRVSKKLSKKLKRIINRGSSMTKLTNGPLCPSEMYVPNVFFEIRKDQEYNIIVLSECYLYYPPYKGLMKLYGRFSKVLKKMEYFGLEDFEATNTPNGSNRVLWFFRRG